MKDTLEMLIEDSPENQETKKAGIGIRVKIGDVETVLPISPAFSSYNGLASYIESIKKGFDEIMEQAEDILPQGNEVDGGEMASDMPADEIWEIISGIEDNKKLVVKFNELDEVTRRKVADHVLTNCSVFSGPASFFSSNFSQKTGLLSD